MSVIPNPIPQQSFEVVRDQVGTIVATELAAQFGKTYEPAIKATVWRERITPFSHTEMPAVNVCFTGGPTDRQDIKQADGVYSYYIDCYHSSKASQDAQLPDAAAMAKLHRLMGVIRGILMDARYMTLGFAPPFIGNRTIANILIGDPGKMDATTMVFGRLVLNVRVREIVDLKVPPLLANFVTPVKLYLTEKGYIWSGSTPI